MKPRATPPTKRLSSLPPEAATTAQKQVPSGRLQLSLTKKLIFSVVLLVLSFGLLELCLAVVGVRPERAESDPYAGFSSNYPLFVEQSDSAGHAMMVTAKNRLEFFNPQQFPKIKPPGTFRLFSLGGSTTYGHPYSDPTSFNGWLRAFLNALAPGKQWEAINAGGISYGSSREVALMRELMRYQPDLFVVYCGQNEFLERRLEAKIPVHNAFERACIDLAAHSRSATLIKRAVLRRARDATAVTTANPEITREPVTLLENGLGPSAYTRDDALRAQTFEAYRANLTRMIEIAHSAGARIIFVLPSSNLRDVSPFKSRISDALSKADQARWLELYRQARQDVANPVPTNGLAALAEAAQLDDRSANAHFLRGRILEKLGRYAEAKAAYERALEEDLCPLRTPAAIQQALRDVTKKEGVPLVDFVSLQEAHSEHGIPGSEVFLDHVHPTVESHRLLALEIIKAMEAEGDIKPDWDPAILQRVTSQVMSRVDNRVNGLALMNLCKTLGWAGKREEAYRSGMQAIKVAADVAAIRYEAGLAAQLIGRTNEAVELYTRAIELDPTLGSAHCNLGGLFEDLGNLPAAIAQYQLAIQYGKPATAERDRRNLADALAKSRTLPATNSNNQ